MEAASLARLDDSHAAALHPPGDADVAGHVLGCVAVLLAVLWARPVVVALEPLRVCDGVGEDLHLEFTLSETGPVECTIQVTHVEPPYLGALITKISPDHQRELSRFIEQLNALNMIGI